MEARQHSKVQEVWSTTTGKPERFSKSILELSFSDDYSSAIQEWETYHDVFVHYNYCICSQHIENNYAYKNKITEEILVIGSECINKFGSAEMINGMKMKRKAANYTGTKRQCQNCGRHSIAADSESWKKVCKSCYTKGHKTPSNDYLKSTGNTRKCVSCENLIAATEPEWKKKCIRCFKNGK